MNMRAHQNHPTNRVGLGHRALVIAICCLALLSGQVLASTTVLAHPAASRAATSPLGAPSLSPMAFATCSQLPAHVDLASLSDAQLVAYGLPLHQELVASLGRWQKLVSTQPEHVCAKASPLPGQIGAPKQDNSCPTPLTYQENCGSTWDGKEAYYGRGHFTIGWTAFHVPHITGSHGYGAAFWVGVGGDSAVAGNCYGCVVLVQDGIIDSINSSGVQYNESFVEVIPSPTENAENLPLCRLSVGDFIDSYVSSNYAGSGYDYFYMDNLTANCSNSCFVETTNPNVSTTCYGLGAGSEYNSDSATGEMIAEKPSNASGLADWNPTGNSLGFTDCELNELVLNTFVYVNDWIEDSSGYDMANSGSISGGNAFTVYWHRYT